MHSPTRIPASKRQSIFSTSSVLSTASHTSHSVSPSSHSSTAAWVPYASLRATGTVHNKIVQRQRQHSFDAQQQQVALLPTTPRRQHVYKPATPPVLPPLEAAEEKQSDEAAVETAAALTGRQQLRDEQKEAIDTQRSTESSSSSRPTTAGKSARSRAPTTTNKQQQQSPQDSQQPTDQPPQPQPPAPSHPLIDPLPAYLSVVPPSERLTRLAEKRAAAHHSIVASFHDWQTTHKTQQRHLFNTLATHFLTTHRHLLALPSTAHNQQSAAAVSAAVDRLIVDMQTAMVRAVEEGLDGVATAVRQCVERLVEVGWRREGEVWAELRGVVEAWNVWTVRNRRSVAELVYLLRKDELERREKEEELLTKETAEREKEMAATQLAATLASDATAAVTGAAAATA